MSEIERRKAANEAVFRNVNERIEALQHSFAVAEREPLQMVCECDRLDCMERVAVSVDAYELVRSHPDQFIVTPGHEDRRSTRSSASRPATRSSARKRATRATSPSRPTPRS